MEGDIRVMEDLKNQIERGRANFKKSPKDRVSEPYVRARLEGVEELIQKFLKKHESIISKYKEELLDKTSYIQDDVFDCGYESYIVYKGELNAALKAMEPCKSTNSASLDIRKNMIAKLPKITIPDFSGKYSEWSSFKDLFVSLVHDNPALDDVQRLHYLKTQVKGEAEQVIKHIPITHANYTKCWDLLKTRYDNKRYMSNCILKRLFSQRIMNCESAQALKDLLNTTCDCMHELSNLGINISSWDTIVIYIVSSKLDVETRKQWELHVNIACEELPSLDQFKEFLESRFRALEFIEPAKNKPKPNQNNSPKVLHAISNTSQSISCPHCNGAHRLYSCDQFAKEDVNNRQEIVKSLKLCYNCFGSGHTGKYCRLTTKCRICKGKHHTLIHGKSNNPLTVAVATEVSGNDNHLPESSSETNEITNIASHFVTGEVYNQTLLATALIKAESSNGYPQILRALLDQGSQASFISEAAVQLLRLNKIAVKSSISGLGDGQSDLTSKAMVMVNIRSLHDPTFKLQVKAYVLNTVTSVLPEKKFVFPDWEELGRITLADPQYNSPNKIDILLGSEVYCRILKKGLIRNSNGSTIAQDTYLGWVLSGQVGGCDEGKQNCHNVIVNLHVKLEENEFLKKFWELESEPSSIEAKVLTPEEQACEEYFKKTTRRDDSGRYVVKLPFRPDVAPNYGDTRSVAVKRLMSLERRLNKEEKLKDDYAQVLREYTDLDHMEKIPASERKPDIGRVWLPHHAVVRSDKTTTKTRVVFNASSRSAANNVTLNETLMVGPTIQPDLRHTIIRWRLHPVCLTADIIKMYRQIRVAEEDADYQRIVWREDTKDEVHDYRLLTVTFGTSCAPYLAVKALQQVAIDEGENYPLAASRVKTDFYMDDLLTGCQSDTEAVVMYTQMNELLDKGGFKLQKWASNRRGLLEELKENTELDREFGEEDLTKVLGLSWNRRTDDFDYSVKLSSDSAGPQTKREIIGEICRLYDPLGWVSPCIITAKIFIQKLWTAGLDWDDKLPEELLREWERYREELSRLVNFHIPRWMQTTTSDVQVELQGFCDASSAAYAAVVYIRCIAADGKVETHLVTAKTKVAPIKQVSIPRLELCGAVLVAKLLLEVAEVLNVKKSDLHAWTDSSIVLAWLSDHPSRWKTFVANRTSEILNLLDSSQWSYVQSKQNPADCASRGILPSELIENELWKYGPDWLRDNVLPYGKPRAIYTKTDLEAKVIKSHATVTENTCSEVELWSKFSSLRKLIRVVAYCRRFLRLKDPENKSKRITYLTASEIQDSLTCCVRQHQARSFHDEIGSLLKHKNISNKSKLSALNPFLDKNGILRVGGRIERSDLPDGNKHPMIICGDSPVAKLIVADAHEKTLHGGQQLTCSYIRSKYWVTKLKNLVRSHIHGCVGCIRNAARTKTQLMGQLPSCRVTPSKPFLHSGVDYAGPINIRVSKGRGHRSYKGYICLFVCMATRAVYIDAVSDLTSEGFLSVFKRFVARRGRCSHLWSDNGTNFVGASKELKTLLFNERSSFNDDVAASLANNGTEWRFIPPHSPNFGGLWEAGIKSTKHHLRRVIGDSTLTYEEVATVLAQIEACLNSRPLSQLSTDPDDPTVLTPGHFLMGEPPLLAPDQNYEGIEATGLRRWQLTQRMVQHFWRRWSREYITHFFQRYKWNVKTPELKIGDVVLVKEDHLPPAKWLYGRVVAVHPGQDNLIRVVSLKCKNSVIRRPTSKLCPLPINDE